MKKAKIFLQKILYPPVWIYFTVVPASFILLAFVFAGNMTESVTAYISYGLSAYSLAVLIAEAVRLLRKRKRIADRFSEILKSNKIGKRYMENAAFRGSINSMSGIVIDFAYAAFRGVSGVLYGSVWFISMAAYYIALGCMRVYLRACKIKADRNPKERRTAFEKRAYKTTAWLLLLLNIPMGGMIILMVVTDSGFNYPGYIIYLSAIYTFYKIISATIGLFHLRKLGSPLRSSAAILNFVAALMSVLGLQTAMISQFSVNGEEYRRMMNAVTGGCVYFAVIAIAGYMLISSAHNKNGKTNKTEE